MMEASSADGPESPLDAICRNVLQLLATARDTPARLRVEADGMFVEMEWPAKTAPRRDRRPGSGAWRRRPR